MNHRNLMLTGKMFALSLVASSSFFFGDICKIEIILQNLKIFRNVIIKYSAKMQST